MNNVKHFTTKQLAISWGKRNHPGRFRVEQVIISSRSQPLWKVSYNGFYGSYC